MYIEQQIQSRSKNKKRRKKYFSDKKKRHTVKNQLVVNNHGLIIHKLGHKKEHRHDYDIYKKNHPVTPKEVVVNVFDLGYLGLEKDYPEQLSALSCRRKKIRNYLQKKKSTLYTLLNSSGETSSSTIAANNIQRDK